MRTSVEFNLLERQQIKSNQVSVFDENEKPQYQGEKNLSEQCEEQNNSTHLWRQRRIRTWMTLVEGECFTIGPLSRKDMHDCDYCFIACRCYAAVLLVLSLFF